MCRDYLVGNAFSHVKLAGVLLVYIDVTEVAEEMEGKAICHLRRKEIRDMPNIAKSTTRGVIAVWRIRTIKRKRLLANGHRRRV
jgi:hypothetical protein